VDIAQRMAPCPDLREPWPNARRFMSMLEQWQQQQDTSQPAAKAAQGDVDHFRRLGAIEKTREQVGKSQTVCTDSRTLLEPLSKAGPLQLRASPRIGERDTR